MKHAIYLVTAYIVDANGAFNHLDGYPKSFDSKHNNNDPEKTRLSAMSDYFTVLSNMAKRSDRQLQRANVVNVQTSALEAEYSFGAIADLPDAEPEE